jgi:hypothetical protein
MKEFKLCYVDLPAVWFTTQDIKDQWGDDWDDAPYECNAGDPYYPGLYHYTDGTSKPVPRDWNEDGTPKWELKKVFISAEGFAYPAQPPYGYFNPPHSVEDINNGSAPWLIIGDTSLFAGTTYDAFKDVCEKHKIGIYVKEEEKGV